MPIKWDLPKIKPPFWLDEHAELIADPDPLAKSDFVLECVDEIHRVLPDATPIQRFQIAANAIVETGWGKHRKGNNLGGWKITKHTAGSGVGWFRARGNKAPGATIDDLKGGDPPWCYYRTFASFGAYFAAWVANFVPKNGTGRYAKCGKQFWAGEPWFDDLIEAGYKGENTKAHPWKSIDDLNELAEEVATYWAQREVGAQPDGAWGKLSREAAVSWGAARGVEINGSFDSVMGILMPRPVVPVVQPPVKKPEPKAEAPKAEAKSEAKSEAPKAEAKTEAPKTEAPKTEAPKAESKVESKTETKPV